MKAQFHHGQVFGPDAQLDHLDRTEQRQIKKQIESLLDRVVDTESPTLITAYEKRIKKMERQKLILDEKLSTQGKTLHPFEQMFEHALVFLANPWNVWQSGNLLGRKIVLRLAFKERISYSRKTGLRTPETAGLFKALGAIQAKSLIWRSRRDSNPRDPSGPTPLAGERLRPLGHSSAGVFSGNIPKLQAYDLAKFCDTRIFPLKSL